MNKCIYGAPASRMQVSEYETRAVQNSQRYTRELMLDLLGQFCDCERRLKQNISPAAEYDYTAFKNEDDIFIKGSSIHILRHLRYDLHEPHSHDFFEIVCQVRGEGILELSGQPMRLATGTICLLAPGTTHRIEAFADDSIILKIILRQSDFDEIYRRIFKSNTLLSGFFMSSLYSPTGSGRLIFETGGDDDILDTLLRMRYHEVRASSVDGLMKEALLCELFCYLTDRHIGKASSVGGSDTVGRLIVYINEYFRTVTLDDLSREFHFTGNYISRILRRATGSSFGELISRLRVENACRLLCETPLSIGEVMNDSGFGCREFFYKKFREYTGMTPREWRRQNKME
mgnify:FL=1